MQMKLKAPHSLSAESHQAITFLEKISESLKQQRRHFDDAVVVHCIRLIQDYVEDNMRQAELERANSKK